MSHARSSTPAHATGARYITPVTQRRQRPRWWVVVLRAVVVLALIAVVGGAVLVATAPLPTPTSEPVPVEIVPTDASAASLAWPERGAGGFVVEGLAGAEGQSATDAVPMASITKLATVLVVLEQKPMSGISGEQITLDATDVSFMQLAFDESAPYLPVRPGQVVTQRQLIDASIVGSEANASMSLARWAFGSVDDFVTAANDWAQRNGLTTMRIADASGLDADGVASPLDMARLGALASADPEVARAMAARSADLPGVGTVATTNPLLGVDGIVGGKTGTLFASGRNLLVQATRTVEGEAFEAIVVITGQVTADDRNDTTRALLASVWPNIQPRELVAAGTVVERTTTPWGATSEATTDDAISTLAWHGATFTAVADVRPASVGLGSREVGTVTVDGTELATTVSAPMLSEPDLLWRLAHPLVVLGLD